MKKVSICILNLLISSIFINYSYGQCYVAELNDLIKISENKNSKGNNLLLIYGSFIIPEESIDTIATTSLISFNDSINSFNDFQKIEINNFERELFFVALIKINDPNLVSKTVNQFYKNLPSYIFYPAALMKNKMNYSIHKNELLDMHLLNTKDTEKQSIKFNGKNFLNKADYELFFQFKEIIPRQ